MDMGTIMEREWLRGITLATYPARNEGPVDDFMLYFTFKVQETRDRSQKSLHQFGKILLNNQSSDPHSCDSCKCTSMAFDVTCMILLMC